MASRSGYRDWGMLLLCNFIWGSQFVAYTIAARQLGPLVAVLVPIGCATILLALLVYSRGRGTGPGNPRKRFTSADLWRFILIGVCGQVAAQTLTAVGVRFTLAANAAVLVLALPIVTAFMGYVLLGERMTTIRWIGFALAIVGVIECSGIRWSELNLGGNNRFLIGNLLLIGAISGSAFYNVYSKKLLVRYPPLEVLLYSYYVVLVFMLPIAISMEPGSFRMLASLKLEVWISLLVLGVFQYCLAMVLYLKVLTHLDATQAGLSNYLITFFGVLMAAAVLHERLTRSVIFGGILVLASTLLVTVYEGRRHAGNVQACTSRKVL